VIDIHHHLLFDLDDGSRTLEMSVAMAEMAIADGITHIVCTPHSSERFRFQPALNQERLAEIQSAVGDRIELGLGCDFHLMYENIEDALHSPNKYTINGKNYLLVEFPDFSISPNTAATFYDLRLSGMVPIITHPERNPLLSKQPERMAEWLATGALIQITAASLSGRFGQKAQQLCHWLLERNWVHFLATDAHNLTTRPPQLRAAYATIEQQYGSEAAERLCVTNPRAAFYGEALPGQPEMLALDEGGDLTARKPGQKKTSVLGKLFFRDR
jgi:protein-tyrosine phosphatase